MEILFDPNIWIAFATLTILEVVLGIDNVILISILADKLPESQRRQARRLGLFAALASRLVLINLVFILANLHRSLFHIAGFELTWREALLIAGGLFLIAKGTLEIHSKVEGPSKTSGISSAPTTMAVVVGQIAVMDIVFSFDSVMTAIGISEVLSVMIAAIVISMIVMVFAVEGISHFIERHPTVKVLALSYMLLIGLALIGEGFELHIPKGYLYFAMAFSLLVEIINMAVRRRELAERPDGTHG